ncbi:MAG: lysylphosphatidylglycerol synthase transmembrane domain-containing protein, partial [Myxococcota bacterium]
MRRNHLQAALAILMSGGAALWFAWGVDWPALGAVLRDVRLGWVLLAALILLGEFGIRALRWQVLLRPLGRDARVSDLFSAQVIGAAVNIFLPFRAGEIAKPLVASRRTGHPLVGVVATAVMERVYDLFGMLSVLLLMALVLAPDAGLDASAENRALVVNLKRYGGLFGVFAMCCMGIFFYLATRKQAARDTFAWIVSIAPGPVGDRFLALFDGFVDGLGNTRDRAGLVQAGALSVWMWMNGALAIFCLFQAFDMDLPFGAACFVAVAIALTVALPQAPGFIGVFHVAIEKTLVLWGQPPAPSKGYAIVFWAVNFLASRMLLRLSPSCQSAMRPTIATGRKLT